MATPGAGRGVGLLCVGVAAALALSRGQRQAALAAGGRPRAPHQGAMPAKLTSFIKFCNFVLAVLAGSFSAVSKRNFATKYAFDSIFQNLPDYLAEFFEIWQNFANCGTFAFFVVEISRKLLIFQIDFLLKFWDCSGAKACTYCRS